MATSKTTTKKASRAKAAPKKATPKNRSSPTTKAASQKAEAKARNLSALDEAATVLAETKQAMNTKEMIEAMATKGLWASPGGKTPWATLYSAILREINVKGKESRFKKTERGKFTANR